MTLRFTSMQPVRHCVSQVLTCKPEWQNVDMRTIPVCLQTLAGDSVLQPHFGTRAFVRAGERLSHFVDAQTSGLFGRSALDPLRAAEGNIERSFGVSQQSGTV